MSKECQNLETCGTRFDDLKSWQHDLRLDMCELQKALVGLTGKVEHLSGRVTGYLVAGGMLGAILAVLAQKVLRP
jgi:hypothetical protein